ncbi:iron reductase domain protein, partial [Sphaerobolus stellatus SS14]
FTDSENGIKFQGYMEAVHGVTFAAVFPPCIDEVISPIVYKWVGMSLGGAMQNSLFLVSGPNGNSIVANTPYALPPVYAGPTLTTLASSHVNSTHWKWVFRCENCTTLGGIRSLNLSASNRWAWALSDVAVNNPADPASDFKAHVDNGVWGQELSNAHDANYSKYL